MLESGWAVVHLTSLDLATTTDRRPHKSNWQNLTRKERGNRLGNKERREDFPRKWLANMSSEDHRRKNICTNELNRRLTGAEWERGEGKGRLNLAAGEGREGKWDREVSKRGLATP